MNDNSGNRRGPRGAIAAAPGGLSYPGMPGLALPRWHDPQPGSPARRHGPGLPAALAAMAAHEPGALHTELTRNPRGGPTSTAEDGPSQITTAWETRRMTQKTRRMTHKQRPVRSRLAGAGILAVAASGIVLLAAACGGSSAAANTFAPGATHAQSVAFAKCMRANGVPGFPDPDGQGNFNNAQIQALTNGPQGDSALHQCRSVLPNAGTGLTVTQIQTIQQQNLHNAVKAAICMRAHGIPNFPDPAGTTQASGVNWPQTLPGIDTGSPPYEKAYRTCSRADGAIPPWLAPGFVAPSSPPGSGSGPGSG